uniref:Uncharacterized protein n=1 Tax=Avena sativa TaxID=4498 RepID=A0ACD5ZAB0_AVESA
MSAFPRHTTLVSMTRMSFFPVLVVQLLLLVAGRVAGGPWQEEFLRPRSEDVAGTRWAVLIAGSKGFVNYRHQADVCHAYQIMKRGGLRDENIIVFMYDDIANNTANPKPGVIINHPNGSDVYAGVPKDYTGADVNVNNFLAVLLGNKSALTGGSGKVVSSSPDDHIFVYYTDHGGPGVLGMPGNETLYANDLVATLEKKHAAGTYKSLVFYLEACESGSIFEGLLPANISIYATTASNANESSWATYCDHAEIMSCLGDLYSVAWMEDSDAHNLRNESLAQQYNSVKNRTISSALSSHVMQYGDLGLNAEDLDLFMGSSDPANRSATVFGGEGNWRSQLSRVVEQRDADLVYLWQKYRKSEGGISEKSKARKQLLEVMAHRSRVDDSVELIGRSLFGRDGPQVLNAVRPAGQPLVDDWDCLKSMVRAFEEHCGLLGQYGMKHMRAFANICNAGVGPVAMHNDVAPKACPTPTPSAF